MKRCLLISNRLPISVNILENKLTVNSGGLVSAIRGIHPKKVKMSFEWMGITTDKNEYEFINKSKNNLLINFSFHPKLIDQELYQDYYNQYCNKVLWPLFHYERNMVRHNLKGWHAYCKVNQKIADSILKVASNNDLIWIHDFHFFLIPKYLKEIKPSLKVGFFLHIPFPSSEVFRELPQKKEIINSLLSCDQIGFHDLSYLNHFKSSVQRVIGNISAKKTSLGVYPISIDSEHFMNLSKEKETKRNIQSLKKKKGKMKWILGIDRLDYIKGLPLKLRAFKIFLKKFPDFHKKVQLVQVIIPSRLNVPDYIKLKRKIDQLISSINGEFGKPDWTPIVYIYNSVSENELSALYQLSDALHISSRRDGMNLVSLEYVSSQKPTNPGVILMSEFAGAHSMLSYAKSINPWDTYDTAEKIKEAFDYSLDNRKKEIKSMQNYLLNYNSSDWAKLFLSDLLHRTQKIKSSPIKKAGKDLNQFKDLKNKKIFLFFDYDGTLAPIKSQPEKVSLDFRTRNVLNKINHHQNLDFMIVSGRDKEFLTKEFLNNNLNFKLAACHGAFYFCPSQNDWLNMIPAAPLFWKKDVLEILNLYTQRTPQSFIEDKGHSLSWHYRDSPKKFSTSLAIKLYYDLVDHLKNTATQVIRGKKVIEIKSINANKGFFVDEWINKLSVKPDLFFALGDDSTDEDMFNVLQERKDINSICIKVGRSSSFANYHLRAQPEVNDFLEDLIRRMG